MNTAIELRLIERIVGVLIGGWTIYLGYRLFLRIPLAKDSSGRVTLGNFKVVLSRAAPGLFFALYGATIVGVSFYRQVQYEVRNGSGETMRVTALESPTGDTGADALQNARNVRSKDIAVLNDLLTKLNPKLAPEDRNLALWNVASVKFALMEPVWDEAHWGNRSAFRQWVEAHEPEPPDTKLEKQAVDYFRYGGGKP